MVPWRFRDLEWVYLGERSLDLCFSVFSILGFIIVTRVDSGMISFL